MFDGKILKICYQLQIPSVVDRIQEKCALQFSLTATHTDYTDLLNSLTFGDLNATTVLSHNRFQFSFERCERLKTL